MDPRAGRYYDELGMDYPASIRQLVPAYDDLTGTLAGLLARAAPDTILDVGCGEGSLTRRILESVPGARITAVDASASMLETAGKRLEDEAERVRLVRARLEEWRPDGPFEAAYSNLVLHNLARERKARVLVRIRESLLPGGIFLWGDLIRYEDEELQEHFVGLRIRHARERGCDEELIRMNFEKEAEDDDPLTLPGMLEAGRGAGFSRADPVWIRGTFALVRLKA